MTSSAPVDGVDDPPAGSARSPRRIRLLRPAAWWLTAALVAAAPFLAAVRDPARPHQGWWFWPGTALALGLGAVLARTRAARTDSALSSRWSRCAAAVLFLASFLVFMSNRAWVTSGDNLPNRLLPVSIASGSGFQLQRVAPPEAVRHYAFRRLDGRLVARYPLGTGLAATPFYAAALRFAEARPAALVSNLWFEKSIAALATALAAVFVFFAARRFAGFGPSFLGAISFSLATPALTSLSQGLWSHTGETAFFAGGLALLAAGAHPVRAAGAGAAIAYAVLCRPTAVLLAPIALPYLCAHTRKLRLLAIAGGAAVLATAALLHAHLYGSPLGAYVQLHSRDRFWSLAGFFDRLIGVVASPSRGALVFLPLLFVALALPAAPRERAGARWLRPALILTAASVLMTTALFTRWWGGHSLGPRLLAELSIPTGLALALALSTVRSRRVLAVLLLLLAAQAAIHLSLHRSSRARTWNSRVFVDDNPDVLRSWRNSQLAAALLPGWEYVDDAPYVRRVASANPDREYRWRALSLRGLANARYDPIRGGAPRSGAYLPRLAAAHAALSDAARFDILPPGAPNVVRVCTAELGPAIPVTGDPAEEIDTLILWRQQRPSARGGSKAGHVRLELRDGGVQRLLLRVGREVFDTTLPRPAAVPRLGRLYAGGPLTADALVSQRFALRGSNRRLEAIRIGGPPASNPGCLDLLAISLGSRGSAPSTTSGAAP